ncbi:MAG: Asp23/Gls24 family envelope stress response protein [Sporichthyaceae bacterium]|nr:Asp23/Gls24 family envelope stress response protein [Sporichthyaceae bacterium]
MSKPATEEATQSTQQPDPQRTAIDLSQRGGGALETSHGRTSIADVVVSKIAGIATREVSGVHDLGRGSARAFGQIKQRIPGSSGPAVAQGVSVEVGETQAAVDLDVVVDYGVSIVELAKSIRRNVIISIERMTGLDVVEVNISVDDVFIPGDGSSDQEQQAPSRVQ